MISNCTTSRRNLCKTIADRYLDSRYRNYNENKFENKISYGKNTLFNADELICENPKLLTTYKCNEWFKINNIKFKIGHAIQYSVEDDYPLFG